MEERRTLEVVHVQSEVTVRYKFLAKDRQDAGMDLVHETTTKQISKQGMIASLRIPNPEWIVLLLQKKMILGINLLLPNCEKPLKAVGEVAFLEAFDGSGETTLGGIRFKEMKSDDREEIFRFLIRAQGRKVM